MLPRSLYFGDEGDEGGASEGRCEFEMFEMFVMGTLTVEVSLVDSWFEGIMTFETRVGLFVDLFSVYVCRLVER